MANAQIGSFSGTTNSSRPGWPAAFLANITADGVNTVTVDNISVFRIGQSIDLLDKTLGNTLAANRLVTDLTSGGVLTYNGADVAAVPGTHAIYQGQANALAADGSPSNLNGGHKAAEGWNLGPELVTVGQLRARLTAINATTYSSAELDKMTVNDMLYAIRVNDSPLTVK
jgi:hypothetical protein